MCLRDVDGAFGVARLEVELDGAFVPARGSVGSNLTSCPRPLMPRAGSRATSGVGTRSELADDAAPPARAPAWRARDSYRGISLTSTSLPGFDESFERLLRPFCRLAHFSGRPASAARSASARSCSVGACEPDDARVVAKYSSAARMAVETSGRTTTGSKARTRKSVQEKVPGFRSSGCAPRPGRRV